MGLILDEKHGDALYTGISTSSLMVCLNRLPKDPCSLQAGLAPLVYSGAIAAAPENAAPPKSRWWHNGSGALTRTRVQRSFVGRLRFAKVPLPQDDRGVGRCSTQNWASNTFIVRSPLLLPKCASGCTI